VDPLDPLGLLGLLGLLDLPHPSALEYLRSLGNPLYLEHPRDPRDLQDPRDLRNPELPLHLENQLDPLGQVGPRCRPVHKDPLYPEIPRYLVDPLYPVGLMSLQVQLVLLLPLDLERPVFLLHLGFRLFPVFQLLLVLLVTRQAPERQPFRPLRCYHFYQGYHSCPWLQRDLEYRQGLVRQGRQELLFRLVCLEFLQVLPDQRNQQGRQGRKHLLDRQGQQDQQRLEGLEDHKGAWEPPWYTWEASW